MERDKDLEKIRQQKSKDLMEQSAEKSNEAFHTAGEPTSNKPVEVTDATFTETIQNNSLIVIDCWAPWCGPCRMVSPIIDELAKDYIGRILFRKLNVDENQTVATQYEIMSIPTLLVFKKGKLVDRIIGAMPRQMLESKITQYL